MFKSTQEKIAEKIAAIRKAQEIKPKTATIKRAKRRSKTETTAQTKKTMMLSILNNKNLKATERLERVYKILGNKKSTTF